MSGSVLVIDQGTTSTRAIVFGPDTLPVATAQEEFPQFFPRPGWVEHDPRDLWRTALSTARIARAKAIEGGHQIAAVGIANQRETIVIWDRASGQPIHNAIVWQDRRTAPICDELRRTGCEPLVQARSGLLLDPYFSATKIAWMLDHVAGARERAERGELAFGTVDSFLLWRLTDGQVHATDATNASRTALFDIHKGRWDRDLLKLFRVPRALLPEVRDCAAEFGMAAAEHFGEALPIRGIAGDQQAALIGQACFEPGMVKSTFGTGCFVLLNTGRKPIASTHRLLSTIAYQLKGRRHYALEGSIFAAGATVQWLRDGLGLVRSSAEAGELAAKADPAHPIYLVPARRADLGPGGARHHRGPDARQRPAGAGPGGAGKRRLPDPRPDRRHAGRRRRRDPGRRAAGDPGGRGHERQRLDHAMRGRHDRRPSRPRDHPGDHRARRRLSGGLAVRALPRSGGLCRELAPRTPLRARHAGRRTRRQAQGLARRRLPHGAEAVNRALRPRAWCICRRAR
jgi:glycerol kinase